MANIIDLNESWEKHTGLEVETFVKGQLAQALGGQINTLSISLVDAVNSYNKGAEEVVIKYKVSNTINGQLDADFTVTFFIIQNYGNGGNTRTQIGSPFSPAVYDEETVFSSPNIAKYLSNTADSVDRFIIHVVNNNTGKEAERTLNLSCVYAELSLYDSTDNLNVAAVNRENVQYITKYQGSTADLIVTTSSIFGGNEKRYTLNNVVSNNTPKSVSLNDTETGVRKVDAYLSLNGGSAESSHVSLEMIRVDENTRTGTFIATRSVSGATVYEDYTVYFGVYDGNNTRTNITVEIYDADNVKTADATLVCNCGTLTSAGITTSYTFTVPSRNYTIKFKKGETEIRTINASAETSDIAWKIEEGSELYLTAKGRTNAQVNANVWANNGYETKFTDVEFNPTTTNSGNGWWNSQTLHLTGESKAEVNIYPLYDKTRYQENVAGGGIFGTGRTISFKIKTSNVNNQDDKIVSCWDESNQFGFYIRPDAIYAKIYGKEIVQDFDADQSKSTNNRRFSSGSEIEITLTVGKAFDGSKRLDPEIFLYVNGEIAGFTTITHTSDIVSQNKQIPLSFGCPGANLDLYYVRVYNKCLTKDQVYHNYVMSLNTQNDIKTAYDKNNYDLNSLKDAIRYCKAQSLKKNGNCSIVVTTDLREGVTNTKDTNNKILHELWMIFFKDGKVDVTRTKKYVAKNLKGLRIRVQGTSTAAMPVKNLRYDAKGECYVVYWNPETDDWFEITDSTEVVKKLSIVLEEGDIPCYLLTTKTNYNESTATRNLPNAMWVNDAINALYDYDKNRYGDIITPPQKENRKVRQAIKGIPAIQYYYNKEDGTFMFTGKVDMITDKTNMDVFGFTSDEDFSIELRSNSASACNFHTSNLKDTGVLLEDGVTQGKDLFEYRFPDEDTTWNKSINGHVFFGDNSAFQRLWDFVYNCSQDSEKIGKESNNGVITTHNNLSITGKVPYIMDNGVKKYTVKRQVDKSIQYENVTNWSVPDTAEYRQLKFYAEAKHYIVVNSLIFNGLVSLTHMWTDQRAKNTFFTHFKGDVDENGQWIMRLLPYDIDTSWRGDNDSRLRYDYTREYDDPGIYDDDKSEFWKLMDLCFETEYVQMYQDLNNLGFYSLATLQKYYKDNQVEAYSSSIYNADADYKYTGANASIKTDSAIGQGTSDQTYKAHGSAIEDLDWWMQGRLYYEGGKYFNGATINSEYTKNNLTFNIKMSHNFGNIDLNVTTYQRAYTNWLLGTVLKASGYSDANEVQHIHFDNLITTASDNRVIVYGHEQIKSFGDLSPLLIENIQSNMDLNVVDMKIGSTSSSYTNDAFSGFGNATYGACKLVNVANCTGYSNADLSNFPILETLYATGCTSMVTCSLPSSSSLKYCYLPANLRTISLQNKYNVEEIQIEGVSNINSVTMENCNETVQNFIFDKILKPIYG